MEQQEKTLDTLQVYVLACLIADQVWEWYRDRDYQTKKILGDQLIRAVDSVGANIAEGYGRYHYLDSVKFYYNARGSLLETKHWLETAKKRSLFTQENIFQDIATLGYKLNAFIASIKKQLSTTS